MRINEKLMQLFEKRSFSKSFDRSRTIEEPVEEENEHQIEMTMSDES